MILKGEKGGLSWKGFPEELSSWISVRKGELLDSSSVAQALEDCFL